MSHVLMLSSYDPMLKYMPMRISNKNTKCQIEKTIALDSEKNNDTLTSQCT